MKNVLNSIKLQERGVYVQASTLGSLEALLEFLTQSKIPVSSACLHVHINLICSIVLWDQHRTCSQERCDEGFSHVGTRSAVSYELEKGIDLHACL